MDFLQPLADLIIASGLYGALRRENRRTRAMVHAIGKYLGVRLEDGIHVEQRTPARGQPALPTTNGDAMKRIIPLFLLGMLLGAALGGSASCSYTAADARSDAPKVLDQVATGAATGAASGGPIGAAVGAGIGLLSAIAGIIGAKVHSRGQLGAVQLVSAGLQAANDQLVAHRDLLAQHNDKLAAQLDTAHQLVRVALNIDGPLPPVVANPAPPAPAPSSPAAAA